MSVVQNSFEDTVEMKPWEPDKEKRYFLPLDPRGYLEKKRAGTGIIRRAQVVFEAKHLNPSWFNGQRMLVYYLTGRGELKQLFDVLVDYWKPEALERKDVTDDFGGVGVNCFMIKYLMQQIQGAKVWIKVTLWASYT